MIDGTQVSAIQLSTAAGLVVIVEIFAGGGLQPGFVKQEDIPLKAFFATRWGGRIYNPDFDPTSVKSRSSTSPALAPLAVPEPFEDTDFDPCRPQPRAVWLHPYYSVFPGGFSI